MENPPDFAKTIAQFMASEGIPFENVKNPGFQRFLSQLGVNPTGFHGEELKNRAKIVRNRRKIDENDGPISVTMDVAMADGRSFLVFSVHSFENFFERKHEIFFKKIDEKSTNPSIITEKIGRPDLQISNFLCSKSSNFENLALSDGIIYTCFHEHVDEFANAIVNQNSIRLAVKKVQVFLENLKTNQTALRTFRGFQRTNGRSIVLPILENNTWQSISKFLNEWVELHISLEENRYLSGDDVRNNETFIMIRRIQKILKQCVQSVHELSNEHSSISQVIPAVKLIESQVFEDPKHSRLEAVLRQTCVNVFMPVLSGPSTGRYEIAMLLDPRFAWNHLIYTSEKWIRVQKTFMGQALLKNFSEAEKAFLELNEQEEEHFEISDRFGVFERELRDYRTIIAASGGRYSTIQNPLTEFWRHHHRRLRFLTVMAREYLACPAIAIDAAYYFGESSGKFLRFWRRYQKDSEADVERLLDVASYDQEFRRRGFSEAVKCLEVSTPPDSSRPVTYSGPPPLFFGGRRRDRRTTSRPSTSSEFHAPGQEGPVKIEDPEDPLFYEQQRPAEPKRRKLQNRLNPEPEPERKPENLLEEGAAIVKLEEPEDEYRSVGPSESLKLARGALNLKEKEAYQVSMLLDPKMEDAEGTQIVLSDAWNVPEPRPPSPKPPKPYVKVDYRCWQCKHAGSQIPKKHFNLPEDRILVLMTAVLHKRMRLSDAIEAYPVNNRSYCATHVHETCRFLMMDVLGVDRVDQIQKMSSETVIKDRVLEIFAKIQELEMVRESASFLKDLAQKFIYKHSLDFNCILCHRRFHRLQMFIVSTSAGNLSRWITSGKIQELDVGSEYRKMERLDLYKLFQTMTDRYLCKQHFHFPNKCTSAMGRLLAPERVLGEGSGEEQEYVEEEEEEDEE